VRAQDTLGFVTTTIYNPVNNPLATIDPLLARTSYVYDILERQTAVRQPLGRTVTTIYEDRGLVLATTRPPMSPLPIKPPVSVMKSTGAMAPGKPSRPRQTTAPASPSNTSSRMPAPL
jgi:YD repeat-containing protein